MRWALLIFVLMIAPLASAITTTMAPVYQPGETMIIQIQGSILQPIPKENVVFKRAHVAIAVNYDIKRVGNSYYLYAQLPTAQNNYTLFINDIATTQSGLVTSVDYNQTFTVNGTLVDYAINPGLAIVRDEVVFTITLNLDTPQTINLNFPTEQAITLQPGTNTIRLPTGAPGVYQAAIGRYTIPIQVLSTASDPISQNASIRISPTAIHRIILSGNPVSYPITLINDGTSSLGASFSFNPEALEVIPSAVTLAPNTSQTINLSLKRTSGSPMQEIVTVNTGETQSQILLNISFTSNVSQIQVIQDNNTQAPQYYCAELSGKFCTAAEVCSTELIQALDGGCCTGTCEIEESGGFGWIGYVAVGIIIIILLFVFLKYRKSKVPKPKPGLIAPPPRITAK